MNFSKSSVEKKHQQLISSTRKLSTKFLVNIFRVLVFAIILLIAAGGFMGLGMVSSIIEGAPDVEDLSIAPVGFSTTVYDCDGNQIEKLTTTGSNRIPVSIEDIPQHLQYAFIDIEDERFYEHNGIDVKGILRAGVQFITSGAKQGASTITQQLLKNNVFEDGGFEDNIGALIKRKIQEQYLALELEKTTSKQIILENYLNTIFLGSDCYGVQAASLRYFNKDVSELTVSESAVIAAITQNPTKYNPITHPEENAKRRQTSLDNMYANGHITEEEYNEAINDDVYSRIQVVSAQTDNTSPYSYFVDEVIEQVINDLMEQKGYTYTQATNLLYSGGLSIYSTQDSAIQQICDEELSNAANYPPSTYYSFDWRWSIQHEDGTTENFSNVNITYYFKTLLGNDDFKILFSTKEEAQACIDEFKAAYLKDTDIELGESTLYSLQPQASVSVIDQSTGEVKALVGGRGEKTTSRSLNRATDSTRQPGSCFKVLAAILPALENGQTLATVYDDAPYNYSTGRAVKNWWGDYYKGLQNLRYTIAMSDNICAVKALTAIGPDVAMEYLLDLGFTTLVTGRELADGSVISDYTQSLALGGLTDGVTNMELTAAYAAIANDGVYIEPTFYTKVTDYNGRIILESDPETKRVMKETTAWLLTNAMHDVVTYGSGSGAAVSGQYVSGKTGTTSNTYDLWFTGYTNYYTAAVWTGFDENVSIEKYCEFTYFRNTIWSRIMSRIHTEKGLTSVAPEVPDSIVTAQICKKCGYLAVDGLCDKDPEGSQITTEYFAEGTVPTETCKCHVEYSICTESGALANDNCPESSIEKRVYRVRFLGDTGETEDTPYTLPEELENSTCIIHTGD